MICQPCALNQHHNHQSLIQAIGGIYQCECSCWAQQIKPGTLIEVPRTAAYEPKIIDMVQYIKLRITELTKEEQQELYEFLHNSCDCRIR